MTADQAFHVQLATSPDLMDWTWEVELADLASQPTIAAASDGGYVVAWEQEPDPIHMVIASFATWDDLRAGRVMRRFDVPVTMPACGEGTPSIDAASSERVDLGFHYHGDCERDREASGTNRLDELAGGRPAGTGPGADRPRRGRPHRRPGHDLVPWPRPDAHRGPGDPRRLRAPGARSSTTTRPARPRSSASGRTPAAWPSATRRSSRIEIGGREAILVTLYVFTEGAQGGEDEELLFYRTLPDGTD